MSHPSLPLRVTRRYYKRGPGDINISSGVDGMSAVHLLTCAEYCCQRSLCGYWAADGTVLPSIRGRVTNYFSFLNVQTRCGAHPASDSVGSGISLGRKAAGV